MVVLNGAATIRNLIENISKKIKSRFICHSEPQNKIIIDWTTNLIPYEITKQKCSFDRSRFRGVHSAQKILGPLLNRGKVKGPVAKRKEEQQIRIRNAVSRRKISSIFNRPEELVLPTDNNDNNNNNIVKKNINFKDRLAQEIAAFNTFEVKTPDDLLEVSLLTHYMQQRYILDFTNLTITSVGNLISDKDLLTDYVRTCHSLFNISLRTRQVRIQTRAIQTRTIFQVFGS